MENVAYIENKKEREKKLLQHIDIMGEKKYFISYTRLTLTLSPLFYFEKMTHTYNITYSKFNPNLYKYTYMDVCLCMVL